MTSGTEPRTADHWWWRPGWAQGRTFYTWHCTFQNQPQVHGLAQKYRDALAGVPDLDLVPDLWLHLTMQGLGFTDEVSTTDVDAIVVEAQKRLALIPAFDIEFDRPTFTPEAVRWDPEGPVDAVRDAIREAIASVWPQVPEPAEGFSAHVTIAYANHDGPADKVLAALQDVPSQPVVASIASADLIILNRDQRMYEWEPYATASLSKGTSLG
jgi:2'-5' RNA ligase